MGFVRVFIKCSSHPHHGESGTVELDEHGRATVKTFLFSDSPMVEVSLDNGQSCFAKSCDLKKV